ncbi:hypothetical protein CLV47_12328 [Antricoccus suffuscus]|uniref:Uncharacterized protein n=1 Tax=Antricoccus suffuscus TaxID=1629062 RepID=A0A2T0ZEM2_9ACTN|nr:hypothetical protein [Antricoccus suffuscus]PRZ34796.1 hypothetical protein CLV47_12328 [Antricoccus suffuscus]
MHRTRIRHIPADPALPASDDTRSHASPGFAGGYYFQTIRDDAALPVTQPGDLLYTELIIDDQHVKQSWWIAGEDYLLPITDDQLLDHLTAGVVEAAETLLCP